MFTNGMSSNTLPTCINVYVHMTVHVQSLFPFMVLAINRNGHRFQYHLHDYSTCMSLYVLFVHVCLVCLF